MAEFKPQESNTSTITDAADLNVKGRQASLPHVGMVDTANEVTLRVEYLTSRETRVRRGGTPWGLAR